MRVDWLIQLFEYHLNSIYIHHALPVTMDTK